MKKIMLIAAAAAGLVAMADGVESGVVGYNTVTVATKYSIIGVNFTAPDGTALSIQDAIKYTDGMTKGNATSNADQIQVMDSDENYVTYFLSNGKSGRNTVEGADGKWIRSGTAVISDATLPAGTAFWYVPAKTEEAINASPFEITVAGGVLATASTAKDIHVTYQHIANPYAADLPLNNCIPYVEGMTKGNATSNADQIQVMEADGTYTTYFLSNGKSGRNTVEGADGKWIKSGTAVIADGVIPAGRAAWFVRKGNTAFNLQILKPYDL